MCEFEPRVLPEQAGALLTYSHPISHYILVVVGTDFIAFWWWELAKLMLFVYFAAGFMVAICWMASFFFLVVIRAADP
jgi:hypothetical protein